MLIIICYYYYIYRYDTSFVKNTSKDINYDKIFKRNENNIRKILKKGEVIDKEIIKEKTDGDYEIFKRDYFNNFIEIKKHISMKEILYVIFNLSFLFLSIIIGSCVI